MQNLTDYNQLLSLQRKYFLDKVKKTDAAARIDKLKKLEKLILERQMEIEAALRLDFGKPAAQVKMTETFPVLSAIRHSMKHLTKWMRDVSVSSSLVLFGTSSRIVYEPKGVVLIIGPWNFPFQLTLVPLVNAIAAGNCVVIKPSELTPNISSLIKGLLTEIFAEHEVAVIEGDASVTQQLLALPFDHIFFTGSPRVGKVVMEAAAKHLVPITLELGGKSPAILDKSALVRDAAEKIIWGKFFNAGQTCIAPDYVLLHETQKDQFIDAAKTVIHQFTKNVIDKRPDDCCQIINMSNYNRLKQLVDESVNQGAIIAEGGIFDNNDRYISFTILQDVRWDMPIMSEEIFGPILPVLTYKSLEEVYSLLSKLPKPLALYAFTQNKKIEKEIILNTAAGGAVINNTLLQITNSSLPFGGSGSSGLGNYHGFYGFRTFSHERAVLKQGPINFIKLFYPPYTKKVLILTNFLVRFLK